MAVRQDVSGISYWWQNKGFGYWRTVLIKLLCSIKEQSFHCFSQAIWRGTCNIYLNSALRRNLQLEVWVWLRPTLWTVVFPGLQPAPQCSALRHMSVRMYFYWVLYPYSNCGSSRCLYTYCRTHLPSLCCGFWLYPHFVFREKLFLKSCGTWSLQNLEGDVSNLTKKEMGGASCRQTNSPEVHMTNSGVMCSTELEPTTSLG